MIRAMGNLIGRDSEKLLLKEYAASDRAEFVAVYGRRRVGKTFLITETFGNDFSFETSGVLNGSKREQMFSFCNSLKNSGYDGKVPQNWMEAFEALKEVLIPKLKKKSVLIFIDELPCLDTPKSGLINAIDHFWNSWASRQNNLKMIVCGSATTWIIDNIIDNHGGLHNRITHEMHLRPFSLNETHRYLEENGFRWNKLMTAQIYMVLGGIPYYLSLLERRKSAAENIDRLFFSEDAELYREYDRLFKSLFKSPLPYTKVVQLLSESGKGLTRSEISEKIEWKSGGNLSKILTNLENCDFIRKYNVREKKINEKNGIYQLTDFYTRFYNVFCRKRTTDEHFWSNTINTPKQNTWYGLAFERLCMSHIPQIKSALGINGIHTEYYSWRSRQSKPAAQIDLIIERADHIINLCEIKYAKGPYSIDAEEEEKLRNRIYDFGQETGSNEAIHLTMITTFSLKENLHSSEVTDVVTLEDLFR